jgi:hypothetical protein
VKKYPKIGIGAALGVNLGFWTLLAVGCVTGESCLELLTFLPVFFYTPVSWLFTWYPLLGDMSFGASVLVISFIGLLQHLLLGWLVGLAIQRLVDRRPS